MSAASRFCPGGVRPRARLLVSSLVGFVAIATLPGCSSSSHHSAPAGADATSAAAACDPASFQPSKFRPATIAITANTTACRDLLVKAVGVPSTTVRLAAGLALDLSGLENVPIAGGVTLTSEQPAAVGVGKTASAAGGKLVSGRSGLNLGPLLYTSTRPDHLFSIVCNPGDNRSGDNVRLYGFRLIGPDMGVADGNDHKENGIYIESCLGVEIGDTELAGWSGEAIYITDSPDNSRMDNPQAVNIHDNFIHNNQHNGEEGYGVDVALGAWATIARNVFDFDRHAITAFGNPGDGYLADQNLILEGVGVHRPGIPFLGHTHPFDVHGDDNCGPGSVVNKKLWNCGHAGDRFWFTANSFQYWEDVAIKIRGTPTVQALIDDNVFPQGSVDDALDFTEGKTNIVIGSNTSGVQSFGSYGGCDMDGDGRDDLFLPTGATWWYSSAGKMQWTYLNRAHERWGKLALGYFDGDQRCDVLTVDNGQILISSGGTGPWTPLGLSGVTFDQLAFGHFSNLRDNRPGHHMTEIFRRAPNGEWSYVVPGQHDWHPLASSSFPLDDLRFGDFNGDGVTDVLAVEEGHWSISSGGTGSWQPLNPRLSTPVNEFLVADVDGNGTDDILRPSIGGGVTWYVSWDGRSDWTKLAEVVLPQAGPGETHLAFGRFTGNAGVDLLAFDSTARTGLILNKANTQPAPYSLYPY